MHWLGDVVVEEEETERMACLCFLPLPGKRGAIRSMAAAMVSSRRHRRVVPARTAAMRENVLAGAVLLHYLWEDQFCYCSRAVYAMEGGVTTSPTRAFPVFITGHVSRSTDLLCYQLAVRRRMLGKNVVFARKHVLMFGGNMAQE
jgi:hypothetical protein